VWYSVVVRGVVVDDIRCPLLLPLPAAFSLAGNDVGLLSFKRVLTYVIQAVVCVYSLFVLVAVVLFSHSSWRLVRLLPGR